MRPLLLVPLFCIYVTQLFGQHGDSITINAGSLVHQQSRNELKDKPLIERIVPGFTVQVERTSDDIFIDVNPHVGYCVSAKLTAGVGWNHRITFDKKHQWFMNVSPVYGPRGFAEFKLGKGFAPRAEMELMNTLIPATVLKINSEVKYSQWIPGAFVGMKKEYQFFRNVRGTGMIMFRLFNPSHKSPYADVVNVRVGFEFPTKRSTTPGS